MFLFYVCRRLDGLRNALDGLVHLVQRCLDLLRRLARLLSELADFLCDDGKAAALLTSTGSLDGRVEAEEVRLARDVRDEIDDLDRICVLLLQEACLLDRLLACLCESACALGHLLDRLINRLRRRSNLLDGRRQFLDILLVFAIAV